MVDAVVYFVQPVALLTVVLLRSAAVAERIDIVNNTFVDVTHKKISLFSFGIIIIS